MIQEEKQLLLVDLCARLPYGVKLKVGNDTLSLDSFRFDNGLYKSIEKIVNAGYKPYLRPMSSMKKEEEKEVIILWNEDFVDKRSIYHCYPKTTDFYNKHHLDYRGLIEKGLALEAPEGMYVIDIKHIKSEQEQIEELAELKRKLSK